jgi:hypothetical protein
MRHTKLASDHHKFVADNHHRLRNHHHPGRRNIPGSLKRFHIHQQCPHSLHREEYRRPYPNRKSIQSGTQGRSEGEYPAVQALHQKTRQYNSLEGQHKSIRPGNDRFLVRVRQPDMSPFRGYRTIPASIILLGLEVCRQIHKYHPPTCMADGRLAQSPPPTDQGRRKMCTGLHQMRRPPGQHTRQGKASDHIQRQPLLIPLPRMSR